jgi:hypothetical protein
MGNAISGGFKKFGPSAVSFAKSTIGGLRQVSKYADKGKELYSKLGDGEKEMLNRGLKEAMNKAGPERTKLLSRGLETGNKLLEAVKKDGDSLTQKLNEVERVSQMTPAEQMRVVGENAKNVDFKRLQEDMKGPIDRLESMMM